MLVKLVEVYKRDSYTSDKEPRFSLRETYINPDHVVYMREGSSIRQVLRETSCLPDLDARQEFTVVYINAGHVGTKFNIVGSLAAIQEKLCTKKEVLRG